MNERLEPLAHLGLTGLRIALIIGVAWLAVVLAQRAIRVLRLRIEHRLDDRESVQRAETLGRVARYLVAVVISALAAMLVLAEMGVSLAPILGAAGVAGLAVGFGAQSLVRDYFTGFFLLLENQIRQGDVVTLGNHSGLVEEITLRYVRLRDYDGNVHFVPNGTITSVVNMSRGFAYAVIDAGVAYGTDVDRAMALMQEVAQGLRADPSYAPRILDPLEMAGVERWDDSAIVLRARLRVTPLEQWNVRREFLRRLKLRFDAAGIEIPLPQLSLHMRPGRPATRREVADLQRHMQPPATQDSPPRTART